MKKLSTIFLVLIYIVSFTSIYAQFGNEELVHSKFYSSFEKVHAGSEINILVKSVIEETWHINSNSPNDDFLIPTKLELQGIDGFKLSKILYPSPIDMQFGFSDKPVSVFEGEFDIKGVLEVSEQVQSGDYNLVLNLTYQACNNQSCMAPVTITDTISISVVDAQTPVKEINSELFTFVSDNQVKATEKVSEEDSLVSTLESSGLIVSLLIIFLGGLALNLTPCVYPLIPITIGYFGGQTEGNTKRLFLLGVLYVLGMALTYSVVGVITSLSGAVFGSLLQNPITIIIIAAVLVVLSLSMFGLYEFKMPDSWVMKAGGARSGVLGAFFMGLTMGIVAAPCIGPFVLGLVTYVAAKGDPVNGFLMFFFLALGLGTPYLFLALFSGKIKNLPRAGFWMNAVKTIFGFVLIGMAIYFLLPILPEPINAYALPVFMILAAVYLLFVDKTANNILGFRIFKTVFALLIIALGSYMLMPSEKASPAWQEYSDAGYEEALNNNEKMIIDFYADWCIPCKELDALTFSDPSVIEKSKEFKAFKVDMTQTMSDKTEILRKKFNVVGMPTILIIDSNGKEQKRVTGFVPAEEFLGYMNDIN